MSLSKSILRKAALVAITSSLALSSVGVNAATYTSNGHSVKGKVGYATVVDIDRNAVVQSLESQNSGAIKGAGAAGGAAIAIATVGKSIGNGVAGLLGGLAGFAAGSALASPGNEEQDAFTIKDSGGEVVLVQAKDKATEKCKVGDTARVFITDSDMRVVGCMAPK